MEGLSSPGLPFVPVLAVVVGAVYSARLRRHGEGSTPAPLILTSGVWAPKLRLCIDGAGACWNSRPRTYEVDARHGALFLKLLPHGLPGPVRDVQ